MSIAVKLKPSKSLPAVTSILEREDVVPTHSESRLEGKRVHVAEERKLEAAEVGENVPFPQEEQTVSHGLAPTGEIHVSKLFSPFLQNGKHFAN